jgi:hypothetical protein
MAKWALPTWYNYLVTKLLCSRRVDMLKAPVPFYYCTLPTCMKTWPFGWIFLLSSRHCNINACTPAHLHLDDIKAYKARSPPNWAWLYCGAVRARELTGSPYEPNMRRWSVLIDISLPTVLVDHVAWLTYLAPRYIYMPVCHLSSVTNTRLWYEPGPSLSIQYSHIMCCRLLL